ncbi:SWIM zinc finger family protein [Primorskyibacter sp. 2E233]|uniref:SWIM zinc finger family protein n=1 Tax=Primorskyibacter sp. 2E233 TaxID=3413431 RepID=UPI003BF2E892
MDLPEFHFECTSSSTGEIYHIHVSRDGNNLTCTCTCPAGSKRTVCKHRLGVLQGDTNVVSGGDVEHLHLMPSILTGSDVQVELDRLKDLESEMDKLKKRIAAAKKSVAQALDD